MQAFKGIVQRLFIPLAVVRIRDKQLRRDFVVGPVLRQRRLVTGMAGYVELPL